MNHFTLKAITVLLIGTVLTATANAQSYSQPAEYMQVISKELNAIKMDMWDYISSVAHGKSAKKVENRRKDLLNTLSSARSKVSSMGTYKGETALRDSTKAYLAMSYNVINDDYGKIVDMEAIAEESYDAMEAYLRAQELANQKLDAAGDVMEREQKTFAALHEITLLDTKDKTDIKLESASKVIEYYNKVYLVFFKSHKQEAYFLEAMNKSDVNGMQQNSNSMVKIAEEALSKLDTMARFNGEATLLSAAKEVMQFHIMEAKEKAPGQIDYFLKKENFAKIKKAFDAKPSNKRTQEDVDAYNKAVNDMNTGVNQYNATNAEMNKKRTEMLDKWNKTVSAFMDKNTPKYKR